jgi:glycosyltransferase involved in cell wall biosynthesis
MRILRVAQKCYPNVKGGGAYHVHAMSRDQAAMGHDVTVLTVDPGRERPQFEERDGYTVVRYPVSMSLLGNDIAAGIASFLQRAQKYNIIHAHSHIYFSTNLTALKRRLGDIPLAITNHGLYSQNASEWLFDLYLRSVGRWTFNQADVVFCYTEEDRERVRELGVGSPIKVVTNGVDTERFTPEGETSELINHDGSVVLFVGRLVDGKRPQDAVRAVSQLPADLSVKLYVVGDGPMRSELEEMAAGAVEFLGHVPYDKIPAVYRAGDALVLPSRAEGLPRTVLEAFASGVPVVSSHLEHTAPVVRAGGETIEIGDVEGYVSALERVLGESQELGADGRQTVVEEFRWQDTVRRSTSVLSSFCSKYGR